MKTKNLLSLLFILAFSSNYLFATDRVVQLAGPGGTYGSISAAITAAVDGDNIVINNRTDLLPWVENLIINKSLSFVSAVDNVQWWIEGTITINMAEGRVVNIVGLKNTLGSGNITKTGSNPVNRTVVNILSSDIAANITMGTGINFHLGSTKVQAVIFSYGKVIGNDLKSLECIADAVATEDVNLVIGNRIGYWIGSGGPGYNHSSATQYLFFSNNYVKGTTSGITISALKSGATINRIINCATVASSSNSSPLYFGLYINHASGDLTVENCVLAANYVTASSGSSGVYVNNGAAFTTFTYNMYYNPYAGATGLNGAQGNTPTGIAEMDNIDINGGLISSSASLVNAGNPLNQFLDLDLTRNDIGVAGGSYSLANFIPWTNNPESSRVNYVNTPRIVYQGNTMNVQTIGIDK